MPKHHSHTRSDRIPSANGPNSHHYHHHPRRKYVRKELGANLHRQLQNISLSSSPTNLFDEQKQILIVDVLNWARGLFWPGLLHKSQPFRSMQIMYENVKKFIHSAKNSNFKLICIIDATNQTIESKEKWIMRRERDLIEENRNVVLGMDILLFDAFKRQSPNNENVKIILPISADADDVIASLAYTTNGIILSRDSDFHWYNEELKICYLPHFDGNKLTCPFQYSSILKLRSKSRNIRSIDNTLSNSSNWSNWNLGIVKKYQPSHSNGIIERGCSSSSDKRWGNLHIISAPLRSAVYHILGENGAKEKMPFWNEERQQCDWTDLFNSPDASLQSIVSDVTKIYEWIRQCDVKFLSAETDNPNDWRSIERRFNTAALAAEIAVAAKNGNGDMTDYLLKLKSIANVR